MDSFARKTLRFITSSPLCESGFCELAVFCDAFAEYAACTEQEVMACLRYLEREGYIRYSTDQFDEIVGFELEHKAYHIFCFAFMEKWQIYVIPAAVTILTTALLRALGWS